MYKRTLGIAVAALALTILAGTPAATGAQETINPADFSSKLTNPYVAFSALHDLKYEGTLAGDGGETIQTSGVMTVLPDEMQTIAGVTVLVVRDEQFEDGELVESTVTTSRSTTTAVCTTLAKTSTSMRMA